jgi:hypothetical protein
MFKADAKCGATGHLPNGRVHPGSQRDSASRRRCNAYAKDAADLHLHATTMAHDSSVTSALEAVSSCPRQKYRRPVKDLSYEVASQVRAYLDHQSCTLPLPWPCPQVV